MPYDPKTDKRKKKKTIIGILLAFLGIDFAALMALPEVAGLDLAASWMDLLLRLKTGDDIIRDISTAILAEADITEKDWVTHPADSEAGVCEYCQEAADNSPYPVDFYLWTHPNCKCTWEPHVE
jgi:hypothetical protein